MFSCSKNPSIKCNCCEKKLKKSDKKKSKGFRKKKFPQCDHCHGKVCFSCGLSNICHECVIKETITLDPDALMQTDRKTLLSYLNTLHCTDYEFHTLDSKYLVKQILMRYKLHEEWDPNTENSPPQLRRSKIRPEPTEQPKPQPAERSGQKHKKATQQLEQIPINTLKARKALNVLPLRDIASAEYFDALSSAELKYFLQENSVSSVHIYEKHDLKRRAIEVWRKFCQDKIRVTSMYEYNRSISKATVVRSEAPRHQPSDHQQPHQQQTRSVRAPSLRNISSPEEIDQLSFDELVIILHKYDLNPHFYKSAVEMVNQVKMLWSSLVGRPAYQQNDSNDSSMNIQFQQPVSSRSKSRSGFHQDPQAQDVQKSIHYPTSEEHQFPSHETSHPSHDNYRRNHGDRTTVEQTVQYANYNVKAQRRGTPSGSRSTLNKEAAAVNGAWSIHQATFVPEFHRIPMQTAQTEHLPPESVSLQDFNRPEEIAALSSQELVELLERHNVRYNQESRINKEDLVTMVTRLWLRKNGLDMTANDVVARTGDHFVSLPEIAQQQTQPGNTTNSIHGQVLHKTKGVSLSDITSVGDIEALKNAQLKAILQQHRRNLDYYTTRSELLLEVRLLWDREQKQNIEGKIVGRNTAQKDQQNEQIDYSMSKSVETSNQSFSIKQKEDMRKSFFGSHDPPPVPSPRSSLQREATNKSNHDMHEIQLQFQHEQSPRRPARPPTPPVRDNDNTKIAHPGTRTTAVVHTVILEPFIDRQESTVLLSPHSPVKPYVPVYPRDREIVRSQSTSSEKDLLNVQNIRHMSKNVSLGDIRAPEEIYEMPVRDIRMLLEKYDVHIYPEAEKGHLIELVTKLWDKRQTQGLGLANKNGQSWERSWSTRSKSSEVVYAELIHESTPITGKAKVHSVEQPHLDPRITDAKMTNLLPTNLSKVQSLQDISSLEIIDKLTSRQIKLILSKHSVDFSACTEKKEMVDCLRNLWHDEKNTDIVSSGDASRHANSCCVCMRRDQPPDCVFLNCGHMIMCMDCGNRTKECPKCHQYIVRVVRVFKS